MCVSFPVLQYSFTNYLVAIIVALTLGQIGSSTPETPNFATQVHQVRGDEGIVLLAGVLLLRQVAWGLGLTVCLPKPPPSRTKCPCIPTAASIQGLSQGFKRHAGQASA